MNVKDNQPQDDSQPPGGRQRAKQSGYWTRIKKKWNRRGVVEIDVDHHRYEMLQCVREGLRDLLAHHPELGPKDELVTSDYTHVLKNAITSANGKVFHFASYASSVFATIRRAIGLSEECFLQSVAPVDEPFLEFMSNSKSGQDFYLTNDKMYFMKTDKEYYISYLMDILGEYLDHFLTYPHSLIVKYLGLFSIQVPGEPKKYFYMMQSIFYPDERIEVRYDVKGCLAGRYQKPPDPGSEVLTVLKDRNFQGDSIDLGGQREWFVKQLRYDANFLKGLGVQDYSLLVGCHALHGDEKDQHLADIVSRVKQSMNPMERKSTAERMNANNSNSEGGEGEGHGHSDESRPTSRESRAGSAAAAPSRLLKRPTLKGRGHTLSFIDRVKLDSINVQNRRLLPKSKNPLHIIDGPVHRYYIGIIDFFTLYECRQRSGRLLKSIKFCCGDHSTIPPPEYAERFHAFIAEHTK